VVLDGAPRGGAPGGGARPCRALPPSFPAQSLNACPYPSALSPPPRQPLGFAIKDTPSGAAALDLRIYHRRMPDFPEAAAAAAAAAPASAAAPAEGARDAGAGAAAVAMRALPRRRSLHGRPAPGGGRDQFDGDSASEAAGRAGAGPKAAAGGAATDLDARPRLAAGLFG
jgi:hypothetical protein